MQIAETPRCIEELDLMKRLDAYSRGEATCNADSSMFGPAAQQSCRTLYSNLVQLVNQMLAPLLDRVGAREMETFTMHDRTHGLKVAHLMWHILTPARRERLTPPEIALLVSSAFLHDVGMALSADERAARLDPTSDLWERLELDESQRKGVQKLRVQIADKETTDIVRGRAIQKLAQAEEALLCQDTRDRHSMMARYQEVLKKLDEFHQEDRVGIPDVETCLSSDGDSFKNKLVDICVSHNEDAESLVKRDEASPGRPRFPTEYPVGRWNADLHMVAGALRLADILDFDRERTPALLYHYLLPGSLDPYESRAVLEWGKHLAISSWHIDDDALVFRGRGRSHILHHAVVHFCGEIAKEIEATRATFGALGEQNLWPFAIPVVVKHDIHADGYTYVPYQFELDDERVYQLLMGGAIYDDALVAVRELVQNAVDACRLRDALQRLYEPVQPDTRERILIRYEEPTDQCPQPRLIVADSGTGMDAFVLERYFLKVGRSFYSSSEFNEYRVRLRKHNLDFAPVSQFGIGFLSCFLLADHIEVGTAMWEPLRGDTRKRTLYIDGPTRLIRLSEQDNEGVDRFRGTSVAMFLTRGRSISSGKMPPSWERVKGYLRQLCQDLPYRLILEHVSGEHLTREWIDPRPLKVTLPAQFEKIAIRVPVLEGTSAFEGEIVLLNPHLGAEAERRLSKKASASIAGVEDGATDMAEAESSDYTSSLLRGGFRVGSVPGLPRTFLINDVSSARLRLTWRSNPGRRYLATNLARQGMVDRHALASRVAQVWVSHFLDHLDELPRAQMYHLDVPETSVSDWTWLEDYDALRVYELAKNGWHFLLRRKGVKRASISAWDRGRGRALWLGPLRTDLYWQLLDLVMPRVTNLVMGAQGSFYLEAPRRDWQDVLSECRDYVSNPVGWGLFIRFVGTIENLVAFEYPGTQYFNSRYRDRLSDFNEDELQRLLEAFGALARTHRKYRAQLTKDQASVFQQAQDVIGDLHIGSIEGSWRIDSFKMPEVP